MTRPIAAIFCLLFFAPALLAHDWPQWRGPGSRGVGTVSRAPERWSPTENVAWRADVEGSGVSSPVIAGNRVYVTTALPTRGRTAVRVVCDALIGLLAILVVPALLRHRWTRRMRTTSQHRLERWCRLVDALDLALFALLAVAILVFGILTGIGPTAVDAGISAVRDIGVNVGRLLGREQTHLSFLEWHGATRQNTWIISSALALTSSSLIPFLFPASPVIRLVGAAALCSGIGLAKAYVPWASAYGDRYPTGALIVLYSPVVAIAIWHLLASQVARPEHARNGRASTRRVPWLATGLAALLSVAFFVSPDYLDEREMLTRRLICLETATGRRVWHADVFTAPPEARSPLNSHATPTPVVVDDAVVVAFGLGVAAVDLDGRVRWSKTFPDWIDNSIYGAASSPVADGDMVVVTSDREFEGQQPSRAIAYSRRTGNELWNLTPEFAHDGYATPVIYDDGHRKLLLTVTSRTLVAYDLASGAVVWKLPTPVAQPVPSLVADGGRMYVTGGRGGDGYTAAYQLHQNAPPHQLWESRRNPADVASPVLYEGRLYTISSAGIMVSYDAASGEVIWRQRLSPALGVFYPSLAAADDKVYAVRSDGTTFVVAANDTFRLLSESSLPDEIRASPAFAADCLFLRTVSALYCIRQ